MPESDDRIERLARRLDWIFLAIAISSGALALLQLLRLSRGATDLVGVMPPVLGVLLALGARRLPAALRLNLLILIVPLLGLALAADLVIAALDWSAQRHVDRRTMAEVVLDLRAEGRSDAVLASRARAYLDEPLRVAGEPVVPLSGLPNAREVLCNETGTWRSYGTDRMGFTNPDSVWDGPADLLLVGDSFTQGFCVPEAESFAGLLRERVPATVNLGGGANGPLAELGTLVEFGHRARPRLVLWFFYEYNDFDDSLLEFEQPLLRAYLEPGASQRLYEWLPAVHGAQRERIEGRLGTSLAPARVSAPSWMEAVRVLRLGHLRHRLGWIRRAPHPYETIDRDAAGALVEDVVRRMRAETDAVGARLVMALLPGRDAVGGVGPHPLRARVVEAATAAGIPVIDVAAAIEADPDPARLFSSNRSSSHLTPVGNRLVAERVLEAIESEGWLASARERGADLGAAPNDQGNAP